VKRAAILAESRLLTQAIADISRAIQLDPDNARFRNTRGYFYLTQQDLPRALQDFNDAIGLDNSFAHPHNNRGLVRIAMGDAPTAVKDFDEALKIDARYVDAYNNRGFALMRQEQYAEAIASFSKAIEIEPKYVNAWNNRAQAHLKAGNPEQAAADLSEAIKLAPRNSGYYLARAEAYTALNREQDAQADKDQAGWLKTLSALTQQALQSPRNASHWISRGRHLLKGSDAQAAMADFNRALQVSPDSVDARCGRAAALLQLDKVDEAIADCNTALANELIPLAASIRGDAYYKKGDLDRAIEDYGLAKRMDSQVARAYLQRSEQRKAAGDTAQAEADLQQAVSLDPSLGGVRQVSAEQPQPK
jgi:tetratricopeptide (TPR) repeat protein